MPPGRYTAKLAVDGVEQVEVVLVRKDPHSAGTEADIASQVTVLSTIRADLEKGAVAVHRIEAIRVQLAELVRTRKVTATELTKLSLDRLKRHGPTLECVVTLTEDGGLKQTRCRLQAHR